MCSNQRNYYVSDKEAIAGALRTRDLSLSLTEVRPYLVAMFPCKILVNTKDQQIGKDNLRILVFVMFSGKILVKQNAKDN
jgi:hypothetical protein